uniref:Haemagglutinin I n=1 Tax=Physarum polycephalum TaxID=5791 RepID=O60949_PHYPO|nr:haemagglutinin I [Physarum polycephalum]3A5P_A Chain A, Haemagglutinin I [Physarum polycephalum]3A5P_B Chain B, Haemagglutinin I [Physarum polycephalum]3A5P_C Chain C, Haemagglutinin I [Physarum polycephalum]3A5P_D Chain D, Haemagglutinin I [Physarum polycephalum]
MVWSVQIVDNAGLGANLALYPSGNSSTVPRYVTVTGYAPITFSEIGPKTVHQSWYITVHNGDDRAFQLGYEGGGVATATFTAGGNVSISTGFGDAQHLTLKKLA